MLGGSFEKSYDDTIMYAELIIYIQNSVTLSYRLVCIYI